MNYRILFFGACLALIVARAQANQPTSLSDSPQAGIPAGWITNYDAALKQAKAEGKNTLLYFTGSDWCGWCIKLHNEILYTQTFKDYAADQFILVYLDFPKKKPQSEALKAQNEALAKRYGIRGFPTLIILNSDSKQIAQMGYQKGGPKPFIQALEQATKD